MKNYSCLSMLLILCFCWEVKAEASWEEKIYELLDKGDSQQALKILEEWKADRGEDDPQYWVAGGNIWAAIARKPTVEISDLPSCSYQIGAVENKEIAIVDPKTGEKVGKIADGKPLINEEDMKKAISFLDEGIRRNPQRLDIFTGRAHLYRTVGDLKGELAALESLAKRPEPKNG